MVRRIMARRCVLPFAHLSLAFPSQARILLPMSDVLQTVTAAAAELGAACGRLRFGGPVAYIYNPLQYAWAGHARYLERFATSHRRVLFVGMNPGPFGMMQTGVPFGEVAAVRDWMGINAPITAPERMHPKRPVEGFACPRSEVSGRRLWGLFAERFGPASKFFTDHFVANYCPLAFLDEGGRNLTPDKFAARETERLFAACDQHLRALATALRPEWVIGVGDFALRRAELALQNEPRPTGGFGKILHPSPASPAANRDWAGAASRQLTALGIW
jgi:single-strand selective monofunctional uracil DNA glycosylase